MSSGEPRPPGGSAAASQLDWLNGDVKRLRDIYERQRAQPMPANARWLTAGRVRVLEHPAADAETAIVYFHGGGFIVGSPLTHADITSELCRRTGLPLYSVDYRLAPDHVAPSPVEDGMAVVRRLLAVGTNRIVLCGDSAGGAIALSMEAHLSALLRPAIVGVCSFYGAYGLFDTPPLRQEGSRADGTDTDCVRRYFAVSNRAGAGNAYGIDALARPSPVPVYLLAGGADPLRADTFAMAEAMDAVHRTVTVAVADRQGHGFLHGASNSPEAAEAMDEISGWILSRAAGTMS